MGREQDADWYNRLYAQMGCGTEQYAPIYQEAARHCRGRVLDMGCGGAAFRAFLPAACTYDGFDFSDVALRAGQRVGNVYSEPLAGYDTYAMLEVLEHVDDLRVLRRIPSEKRVIISVPSDDSAGHVRRYTPASACARFSELLNIEHVRVFQWDYSLNIFAPVEVFQSTLTLITVLIASSKAPEARGADLR